MGLHVSLAHQVPAASRHDVCFTSEPFVLLQTSAAHLDKSFKGSSCDPSVAGGDAWPGVTFALETADFEAAPGDVSVHSVISVHAWDPSCESSPDQLVPADPMQRPGMPGDALPRC